MELTVFGWALHGKIKDGKDLDAVIEMIKEVKSLDLSLCDVRFNYERSSGKTQRCRT